MVKIVICIFLLVLLVVVFILIKKCYKNKEKTLIKKLVYLSSNSIREGNLSGFINMPFHLMEEKRTEIHNQLRFLLWTNPHGLINLINLNVCKKEKDFLNNIMSEVFNFSKQNVTLAASKILGSDMPIENKTLIVSYMASHLKKEKQPYFINFFRDTFKQLGDPMKKSIEEAIGEKL